MSVRDQRSPLSYRSLLPVPSGLFKKSPSGVLARHSRLTISAAFINVPRFIQRGVNRRAQRTALAKSRHSSLGWAGANDGLFEQRAALVKCAGYGSPDLPYSHTTPSTAC